MGRALLIRVQELVSCGISMGWVGVFSGGLIAGECRPKYEIRIKPPLSGVCFGIFIGVLLLYGAFFVQRSDYY
jgi:hypothetical protein